MRTTLVLPKLGRLFKMRRMNSLGERLAASANPGDKLSAAEKIAVYE
jgi:hypothetical protein